MMFLRHNNLFKSNKRKSKGLIMLNDRKLIIISVLFICIIIFPPILPLIDESFLLVKSDKPFGLHIVYGKDPIKEVFENL